ncbi:hypothetical protein DV515_00003322 [Chloebia gouldiae]|uniref:Protein NPAT C-terminal domain-containing protein n=1 Tax=Chloebia gouldiae TaxID=44316 RepID=A0A3L8STX5_CHLGU|nr:hypothetical protein DV515_00003322 [Chloebia gouldiae]
MRAECKDGEDNNMNFMLMSISKFLIGDGESFLEGWVGTSSQLKLTWLVRINMSVKCFNLIFRSGNGDKLTSAEPGRKVEENLPVAPAENTSSNSRQSESHRRVLCFDNVLPTPGGSTQIPAPKSSLQKERNESPLFAVDSASSSAKAQVPKRDKDKTLPRILCRPEVSSNRGTSAKELQPERKVATAGLSLDPFHKTTANKENELRRDTDEKQKSQDTAKLSNGQQSVALWNEKTVASVQELNKKQGSLSNVAGSGKSSVSVSLSSKEPKREPSKASGQGLGLSSPFGKQCVEMLQDAQWQSPAGKTLENGELPVPRTPSGVGDRHTEDTTDGVRTPTCRRFTEDSSTPRIMVPPATPDLPACSPASETGSENSVSMAAHTLMILSRAAIARTSAATPLKDNTHQFRALRSTVKKRKLEDLNEGERNSRSASRKDLQSSPTPSKKKKIKAIVTLLSYRKRSSQILFQQEWMWTSSCCLCIMMNEQKEFEVRPSEAQ